MRTPTPIWQATDVTQGVHPLPPLSPEKLNHDGFGSCPCQVILRCVASPNQRRQRILSHLASGHLPGSFGQIFRESYLADLCMETATFCAIIAGGREAGFAQLTRRTEDSGRIFASRSQYLTMVPGATPDSDGASYRPGSTAQGRAAVQRGTGDGERHRPTVVVTQFKLRSARRRRSAVSRHKDK
jgi:hypothetical protein